MSRAGQRERERGHEEGSILILLHAVVWRTIFQGKVSGVKQLLGVEPNEASRDPVADTAYRPCSWAHKLVVRWFRRLAA